MAGHGIFHWNELMTWDVEKAKAFYGATLGWTFEAMPMPGGFTYTVAKCGDKFAGGMMEMSKEMGFDGVPENWFAYVEVDDVDACVTKVEASGGSVVRPGFDIEGVGRIAIIRDTNNASIGLITPENRS